ncbi:MAG: hypothetical protein KAX55_03780 [Propionivibrio sp.]|nr:hypothetical protein [Propionivibrio sp.]
MITLTLALFVVGGILYTFLGSRTVFVSNDAVAKIQEDARIALERLTREVRQAGFTGCANTLDVTPRVIADVDHNGVADFPFAAGSGIRVYDNGTGWTNTTGITRVAGTDVIHIAGMSACSARLTGNMTADNANIQIGTNPCGWAADQVLLIADCTNIDVFAATTVSTGSVTISHASSNSNNTDNKLSKAYGKEAMVFGYGERTFFVGMHPTLNQPLLYEVGFNGAASSVNDIAANVFDLQVMAAQLDTNADGAPDATVLSEEDEETPLVAPALGAVADWAQVLGVEIRYSIRSEADNTGPSDQTYLFGGAMTTDKRIRRDFSTVIGIRNRLP